MNTSKSTKIVKPQLIEYVITDKIGSGTYAFVHKAFRKIDNREIVAVKCILKSSLNNVSKENLLTEIELLKTLKHKHIVELKDFMWDENYVYLIMEYCEGGDLSKYIRMYRTIPESVAKTFLQQLASALQYMRSKLVCHMDLKPSNILLTSHENPILKIGDFGFAHYLEGETEAMFLRGSLLYMAPEIVTLRQYNEKADLWSVGVILHECLFGKAPFHSSSMKELELKIRSSTPVELPSTTSLSSACQNFLIFLLQRDPDQRMSYEEFFDHPFLDLEHSPSSDSILKAKDMIDQAVRKDGAGDYNEAILLYCQSIEYFMAAIKYTDDKNQKQILRQKVAEYLKRAEDLKLKVKPETPQSADDSKTSVNLEPHKELFLLCQNDKTLMSALEVIRTAEIKEYAENYESSLERYEAGLSILLKSARDEPVGRRKELLHKYISAWMSKAEYIKDYIKIKELRKKSVSVETESDAKLFPCTIQ